MATTPRKSTDPRTPVAVLSLQLSDSDGAVQLTPDGLFRARDGRPKNLPGWKLNPVVAARVIARLRTRQTPIVIDYEHQTLLADDNGQPAPAAGWIDPQTIEYREGSGLWAPVRWTDRAKGYIDAGEYAFLSPVLPYDPQTGDVLDLVQVALTNYPAVDGMAAVAALSARFDLDPTSQEKRVNREQLIELLGLAADATDQQIQAAMVALKARGDLVNQVRQALGVEDGQPISNAVIALKAKADSVPGLEQQIAALKAGGAATPDPAQWVPKAVYDEATGALAALKTSAGAEEIDRLIKDGLESGQIPGKATADWLRGQGLAALKTYLGDAPELAALKGTQTNGKQPQEEQEAAGELSKEELAVCKATGVAPEDFKKTKAAKAA